MKVDSRKFLSVGVLVLISTLAVNGATARETATVKDVSFNTNEDSLEVKITTTQETRFTYFELNRPHRLVVDFHGIQNNIGFREKRITSSGVERVRTSYFESRKRKATRIVFDLAADAPYRVLDDGGGVVRVVFGDTARAPLNLTDGPPVVPEPANSSLTTIPAVRFDPALFGVAISEPLPPAIAQAVAVPAAAQLQQNQTQIQIVPPTPPQVPATTPTPTPQYNGEIISLDLRDYDIKDFFRLMSEISGLNVVLDPNVMGTVTLKLTDVPWDQALDVVLKNYQLGGQLQGNVLRIATNATLQAQR